MTIKLVLLGATVTGAGWLVHGHELPGGLLMVLLFSAVAAKLVAAILRRGGEGRSGSGGKPSKGRGPHPGGSPVPRPPGGKPPTLSATARP